MGVFFDFTDSDYVMRTSDNTAMDSEGNFMIRMSDNTTMDMESGEMHMTSSWDDEEDF